MTEKQAYEATIAAMALLGVIVIAQLLTMIF